MFEPSDRLAFVFPGQGSQAVGMGRAWAERNPAAKEIFATADEVLGQRISELCWEGPADQLRLTANAQPAILTTSIAILESVRQTFAVPVVVAGHSLGEYSALVSARCLEFADAVGLVRERGRFMQDAVPVGEGAMAAILGLDADQVLAIAGEASRDGESCTAANFNAPSQTVISGAKAAVERALVAAKDRGAKRALLLPVSAPFHSPLMAPARKRLEPLLNAANFTDPDTPVVTNIDAQPVTEAGDARDALKRQVDGPVRWVESVRNMQTQFGVTGFVEIGPGAVLTGLIRRVLPGIKAMSVPEPDALEKLKLG